MFTYKEYINSGKEFDDWFVESYDSNPETFFEALEEAALAIGKTRSAATNIRMVCNGKRKTAYGYKWEWRDNKC